MLNGKFPFYLDGQEAEMIALALLDKSKAMESYSVAQMYRLLAQRIRNEKASFHSSTYKMMADQYNLPQLEGIASAIQLVE